MILKTIDEKVKEDLRKKLVLLKIIFQKWNIYIYLLKLIYIFNY